MDDKNELHERERQGARRMVGSPGTPKAPTYVVVAGDSLSKIAKEQLGDASRWPEIVELNKEALPNPNLLKVGQELKLPAK